MKLRSQETTEVKYLASRQTLSAGGQELLESREDVNDEKRASVGEEKRTVVENNGGERIAEMRAGGGGGGDRTELMCLPDIRFQHLVCYSERLRQTERKKKDTAELLTDEMLLWS